MAQMLQRVSYWNLAVALPILGSMAVLREPLLALFGRGYEAGAAPLVLLVIGQLVLNAAGPLTAVINLSGHPRVTLFDNALVFGANLVLCIILVPRYGMAGAAASTLVALCSVTLIQVGQVGAAVPHPPVPGRSAALPRRRRRRRRGDGRAHAPAVAVAAARGRRRRARSSSPSTSPASPRSACATRRENSRNEREIGFCAGDRPGRTHGWDS